MSRISLHYSGLETYLYTSVEMMMRYELEAGKQVFSGKS